MFKTLEKTCIHFSNMHNFSLHLWTFTEHFQCNKMFTNIKVLVIISKQIKENYLPSLSMEERLETPKQDPDCKGP